MRASGGRANAASELPLRATAGDGQSAKFLVGNDGEAILDVGGKQVTLATGGCSLSRHQVPGDRVLRGIAPADVGLAAHLATVPRLHHASESLTRACRDARKLGGFAFAQPLPPVAATQSRTTEAAQVCRI